MFHGQGMGRLLLGKLESAAIGDVRNHVLLTSSVAAKGFYSKFGYTLLHSESTPFGTTFLMGKNLQTEKFSDFRSALIPLSPFAI
jgi:Acetyltransferase (GNAT) domain